MGSTDDRVVHGFGRDRRTEIVRYDRSGKWFIEYGDGRARRRVTVTEAAEAAVRGSAPLGRCGGAAFDRLVRGRRKEIAAARRLPPF